MKKILVILAILFIAISCSIRYVTYSSQTKYPLMQLDSLANTHGLIISDTTYWMKSVYVTDDSKVIMTRTFIDKDKKRTVVVTLISTTEDSLYNLRFRIE